MEELPIDMIRDIPLEYQHLICQGIMKKLTLSWINGTKNFKTKFSAAVMNLISEELIQSRQTKPAEINRPSRSLNCVSFWKATEFRTFLLKLGPVVLQNHLSQQAYNHFLALFCATTICCNPDFLPYLSVAKKLFKDFVDNFGDIYGDENFSYTSHSLIHVTDDVQHFGVLDSYSSFKGESNLAYLKGLIHGGYMPLQQLVKRLLEHESVENIESQVEGKEIELRDNILLMKGLRLDSSENNRWILTKDKRIFKIKSFSKGIDGGNFKFQGVFFRRKDAKGFVHSATSILKIISLCLKAKGKR